MTRFLRALLAVCLALATGGVVGSAPASASTASKSGATVTVAGGAGEANNLTIALAGLNYRVTESGAGVTLTAGAGCVADILPNQILCPRPAGPRSAPTSMGWPTTARPARTTRSRPTSRT